MLAQQLHGTATMKTWQAPGGMPRSLVWGVEIEIFDAERVLDASSSEIGELPSPQIYAFGLVMATMNSAACRVTEKGRYSPVYSPRFHLRTKLVGLDAFENDFFVLVQECRPTGQEHGEQDIKKLIQDGGDR